MSDQNYQVFEYAFRNRGIVAKYISDDTPPQMYANLASCESRQENSIDSRLGPAMITTNGINNVPLADTNVHTLRRLRGIGNTFRYAGAGTNVYRRTGDTNGAYATINGAFTMSGNRFSAEVYRPALSSFPYLYFADQSQMLKDSGTGNLTKWGIAPPTIPVTTVLLNNAILDLAAFAFGGQAYTTVNVGAFAAGTRLTPAVTVAAAIVATGINIVTPSSMTAIMAGMYIIYDVGGGNQENIQIISVTPTTFTAFFTKTHPGAVTLQDLSYGGTVAANTTATVSKATAFNLNLIGGVASGDSDFINLFMFLSDPNQLLQAQILFDVGDGSFTQSYYLTSITPSQIQALVSGTSSAAASVPALVFGRAAGLTNTPLLGQVFEPVIPVGGEPPIEPIVPQQLQTGLSQWSLVQVQKGNFVKVGQAGQPGHDWSAVNAWRISFQTTTTGSVSFAVDDFYLFGGSGLSSLGGVAYDYRVTYFNQNTGDESNGSQPQISSLGILAMNQPIQISWQASADPQVTHAKVYRRGGALTDGNWREVAQVPIGTNTYRDTFADSLVVLDQILALDNDMPVTSTLQVPVNTNLGTNVPGGSLQTVTPGSIANIFPNQRMFVGAGTALETIYVQSVNTGAGTFTAFFQNPHATTDVITASTQPNTPMNLMTIAFDTAWVAGDPNNPHILYFSKIFNPGAFPPQNQLEIGRPDDPITAVVEFRSLLYVFTISRIYSVYAPGGAAPQVYATAEVTYGCVANFGFCVGNGEIKYQAKDGIRKFSGGASQLMTLNVDWLQTGQTFGPIVPADTTKFNLTLMAYFNREMYMSYVDINGIRRRLIWSDDYQRFRNDDLIANGIFTERDTNKLLFSDLSGNIFQDRVNNFDDGGFVAGVQVKNAIPITLQTEALNQGKTKFQKNYQELTVKIDTQGETVAVKLIFNDGLGPVLNLGTITQAGMAVVNLPPINGGNGQLGYNVALQITGNVKNLVTIREFAVKYAMETDTRTTFDTYWVDDGSPEWQLLKQGWFVYVNVPFPVWSPDTAYHVGDKVRNAGISYVAVQGSTGVVPGSDGGVFWAVTNVAIAVSIFIDGNAITPEFSFTLPVTSVRQPFRQRFSPIKCRMYRVICTATADFMMYNDSFVERRSLSSQKGYQRKQLQAAA